MSPVEMMFALLAAHAVCDYPLQGDFLSNAKNHRHAIGANLWPIALPSHGLIHGGAVFALTGSVVLGAAEAISHCLIDWLKCDLRISYAQDQALHVACKLVWLVLWRAGV